MAKMRGLLRPKVDPKELELAQSAVQVRLAQLFGSPDQATAPADVENPGADTGPESPAEHAEALVEPTEVVAEGHSPVSSWVPVGPGPDARVRPPIIVTGAPAAAEITVPEQAEAALEASAEPELVTTRPELEADPWASAESDLEPAPVARELSSVATAPVDDAPAPAPVTRAPRRLSTARRRATTPTRTRSRRALAEATVAPIATASAIAATCPYCALLLDPAPSASRRCPRCRERIVVKKIDGRLAYLTEAAVRAHDAERRRAVSNVQIGRERDRWLRLAGNVGAPSERIERLARARISDRTVESARTLYSSTIERAVRDAKRSRDWQAVARIRRAHALSLYRLASSPLPPPEDIVALHRQAVSAELRRIAGISREAELVGANCCDACRQDDRTVVRISKELLGTRLPHAACPKGLCACRWDLAARDRTMIRRYLRGTKAAAAPTSDGTTGANPD